MVKAIAFDLDDTLMDTSGILVPRASAAAFAILIKAGLKLSQHECEKKRIEVIKTRSHKDVFLHLAQKFGNAETLKAVDLAIQAFYEPELPKALPLLPDALINLNYLKDKYPLYLVTAGVESAQRSKAKALGIDDYFKTIYVTNSLRKERKAEVFLEIIKNLNILPNELLCVGNSLLSEIADAQKIGAMACYFEFGEDRGLLADFGVQKPQFHIRHHKELISTCKL